MRGTTKRLREARRFSGLIAVLCAAFFVAGLVSGPATATPQLRQIQQSWMPDWSAWQQRFQRLQSQAVKGTSEPAKPSVTFIVRLKGETEIDQACKMFGKDADGARALFKTWASRHRGLQGLTLERASYSGDIVVGLPENDPYDRSARDVLSAFQALDSIVYAEVDAYANPTKDD